MIICLFYSLDAKQQNGLANYRYGGWWSVWWMGTYSMVLSKAAFFHRKYLDLYTYKMPSSIHDYVTNERYDTSLVPFLFYFFPLSFFSYFSSFYVVQLLCRNCEDIAMSLLIANATGAPPIWVKGSVLVSTFCL